MLYIGESADEVTDEHEGYVAGRLRSRELTGIWTDVRCLPSSAVVSYVAACECGWHEEQERIPDADGHRDAQQAWLADHLAPLLARRGVSLPLSAEALLLPAPAVAGADADDGRVGVIAAGGRPAC